MRRSRRLPVLFACGLLLFAGCGPQQSGAGPAPDTNRELAGRVQAALESASDLPPELSIEVTDGVVLISGALACEDCGGNRTPGNIGTIQQSLGTVVRAVPGVTEVRFQLDYSNERD